MQNKKKFLPFILLPVLMLSACSSEVMAKPGDYDDQLVTNKDGTALSKEIANNIKSIIYDAKHDDGTVSNDVLKMVYFEISSSIVGRFNTTTEADPVSLKDAAFEADEALHAPTFVKNEKVETFLKNHSIYTIKDADGNRKTDEVSTKREYQKVVSMMKNIADKVSIKMHAKISGGTYSKNNLFSEAKFLMNLRNNFNAVANPNDTDVETYEDVLILPNVKPEEVFDNYLHIENYETDDGKFNYITKNLIPEIYEELLTEEYLFDQSPTTIGRSYARKVKMISFTVNEENPTLAGNLMSEYAQTYVNYKKGEEPNLELDGFEVLETAIKGYKGDNVSDDVWTAATELLTAAGSKHEVKNLDSNLYTGTVDYYTGTSYGKIAENLLKINDNPALSKTEVENDFTGSGSYTVATGLEIKQNSVLLEDYITDGWYIKNGGLTDLDSTIRNRLFNIGVANAIDDLTYPDRFQEDGTYSAKPEGEGNYVAKIHDKFYLKPATSERYDGENFLEDFVWFNKDAQKYTVIEIEEGISSSKLNLESSHSYVDIYGEEKGWTMMEDFSHEVAEVIAKSESYITLAKQHWLEKSEIIYHDDTILEFFKTSFPELFD